MDNLIKLKTSKSKPATKMDKPAEIITLFAEETLSKKEVDLLNRMLETNEWEVLIDKDEISWNLDGVDFYFTTEEALYMQRKIDKDDGLRLELKKLSMILGLLEERRRQKKRNK